jgi:hypothetical protein
MRCGAIPTILRVYGRIPTYMTTERACFGAQASSGHLGTHVDADSAIGCRPERRPSERDVRVKSAGPGSGSSAGPYDPHPRTAVCATPCLRAESPSKFSGYSRRTRVLAACYCRCAPPAWRGQSSGAATGEVGLSAQLARNRMACWCGVSGSAVKTLSRSPCSPGSSKLW